MIAFPSTERRFAPRKGYLNFVYVKKCVVNITHEIVKVICVSVFLSYILIERAYLHLRSRLNNVLE